MRAQIVNGLEPARAYSASTAPAIEKGYGTVDYSTICIQCGKSFEGKRVDTKYCSSTCRSRASREANSNASSGELIAGILSESSESIDSPALSFAAATNGDTESPAWMASFESRFALLSGMSERMQQLESRAITLDRLQSRLSVIENGMTEIMESEARIKRLETEQAKLETQLARLAPLAGLPERLKSLERRASESGDVTNRIEALEARSQAIQRIHKMLTELQSRLEAGIEEVRLRKGLDTTTAQRLIEARIAPLEQRVERVSAQSRAMPHSEDPRLLRLEQRLERLQTRVHALPDEDSTGRLTKLERKLAQLQTQFNETSSSDSELEPALSNLNSRLQSVTGDLSALRSECLQMAYAIRELRGYDGEEDADDNDEADSDWDEDDD